MVRSDRGGRRSGGPPAGKHGFDHRREVSARVVAITRYPRPMRLTVVGCGYLGAVHAACMADFGHEVIGIDVDERKIADLSADERKRLATLLGVKEKDLTEPAHGNEGAEQ